MITAERNRLYLSNTAVKPSIEEHIEWMKNQLKDIDKNLERPDQKEPDMERKGCIAKKRTRSGENNFDHIDGLIT